VLAYSDPQCYGYGLRKYLLTNAGSAPGGQLITDPNPNRIKILNFFLKFLGIFEKIVVKDLDIFTDPDPQILIQNYGSGFRRPINCESIGSGILQIRIEDIAVPEITVTMKGRNQSRF
jgi:hypothetical protein